MDVVSGEMDRRAFYEDVWTHQFPSAVCSFCTTFLQQKWIEVAGLGPCTWKKTTVMQVGDWAWRLNLPFVGTEVFAIGSPSPPSA